MTLTGECLMKVAALVKAGQGFGGFDFNDAQGFDFLDLPGGTLI